MDTDDGSGRRIRIWYRQMRGRDRRIRNGYRQIRTEETETQIRSPEYSPEQRKVNCIFLHRCYNMHKLYL